MSLACPALRITRIGQQERFRVQFQNAVELRTILVQRGNTLHVGNHQIM